MKNITKVIALALVAVMCLAFLASCAPAADPDKALEKLKKNEYAAAKDTTIVPAALTLLGIKGVDCVVSGTKAVEDKDGNKSVETVTIIYFTDKDKVNEYWDKAQEYANKDKKDTKDSDWVCEKSGKMIYFGTKAGVKAAG